MANTDNPIEITVQEFQESYPEFVNPPFTEAVIQRFITLAYCYMSNLNYGFVKGDCREQALMLMVAHLLTIWNNIQNQGGSGGSVGSTTNLGIAQKAKVGEVELSLALPTMQNLYQSWLNATPYGQMLYAMLFAHTPPVLYFGGNRNRIFWTK